MKTQVSIIVPCFNEERYIKEVVMALEELPIARKQIIIVNDGSTDTTGMILKRFAKLPNSIVLHHRDNLGKGAAIMTARPYVQGTYVIIKDADAEQDTQDIRRLLATIRQTRADAVFGSRNIQPGMHRYPLYWLGGVWLSWLTNILFGTSLTDVSAGYKCIRTDLFVQLPLSERGFATCVEMAAHLAMRRARIKEIPVSYYPRTFREGKKIRLIHGMYCAIVLLRLYVLRMSGISVGPRTS